METALIERTEQETALVEERNSLVEQARSMQIVDDSTFAEVAEFDRAVARSIKKVEEHFKPMETDAKRSLKTIQDSKKAEIEPRKEARALGKSKMNAWSAEQARIRQAEVLKAQEEARLAAAMQATASKEEQHAAQGIVKETQRAVVQAATAPIAPKIKGTYTVDIWRATVVDPTLIPDEFIIRSPNMPAIRDYARTWKGEKQIPGVLIEKTIDTRTRT